LPHANAANGDVAGALDTWRRIVSRDHGHAMPKVGQPVRQRGQVAHDAAEPINRRKPAVDKHHVERLAWAVAPSHGSEDCRLGASSRAGPRSFELRMLRTLDRLDRFRRHVVLGAELARFAPSLWDSARVVGLGATIMGKRLVPGWKDARVLLRLRM